MKRWNHLTKEAEHAQYVKYFNEHYSKNVKNRVEESGNVYFLDSYPVSKLIKSYNNKYKDANIDIKPELSKDRDSEGREYAHFVIY